MINKDMDAKAPLLESWAEMKKQPVKEKADVIGLLADADMTITEAATALGVGRAIIYEFCRYHNLDISFKSHPNYKKPDLQVLIDRIALSKTGITITQAAGKIGITAGALRQYSARYNIKWKPASSWT